MYKVILTCNGEFKKALGKYKTKKRAYISFFKKKDENNVNFPKRFINTNGIKDAVFKIHLVKDYEDGDEFEMVKDKQGFLVKDEVMYGKWTRLLSDTYEVEETFSVYGYHYRRDRKDLEGVLKIMIDGNNEEPKNVIVLNNKLIIYNTNKIDLVICKCTKDSQRLHHKLHDLAKSVGLYSIGFLGTCTDQNSSFYYDMLHEETGWSYTKLWRSSTRP